MSYVLGNICSVLSECFWDEPVAILCNGVERVFIAYRCSNCLCLIVRFLFCGAVYREY